MERTKLKCPFCGNTRFIRHGKEEVEIWDTGEGLTDELAGGFNDSFEYFCAECDRNVTEEELVGR